jgi:hypothetical protein
MKRNNLSGQTSHIVTLNVRNANRVAPISSIRFDDSTGLLHIDFAFADGPDYLNPQAFDLIADEFGQLFTDTLAIELRELIVRKLVARAIELE